MRAAVILHDCFGGRGGIAKFNRDALQAMAAMPEVTQIEVLARLAPLDPLGPLPDKIRYRHAGGSLPRFLILLAAARLRGAEFWLCGHLNLVPVVPPGCHLVVHGIEAWRPPPETWRGAWVRRALRRVARVLSVSDLTAERMAAWSGLPRNRFAIVGNTVELATYAPAAEPPPEPVLMSLGRMVEQERHKGFDELLEIMPRLLERQPDVTLVLAGDGPDRPRLDAKARALGIDAKVTFTGYVPEAEKPALYRAATAFSLCGRGEGFGIVLLEAMASGLPVVASCRDGSGEVVEAVGAGEIADPDDREALAAAVLRALARGPGAPPEGLARFAFPAFAARLQEALRSAMARSAAPASAARSR